MDIITLNTHSWIEEKPLEKLKQIASYIKEEKIDIVCLQEINQSIQAKKSNHPRFCQTAQQPPLKEDNFSLLLIRLLEEMGEYYYFSWHPSHIGYDRFDEGNAILSKSPIEAKAHLVSKSHDYKSYKTRTIITGEITYKNKKIQISSCHFSWWKDGFKEEWSKLIKSTKTDHTQLFLGDFNNDANITKQGYEFVLSSSPQLKDLFSAALQVVGEFTVEKAIDGWEKNSESLRIDFGFGNKGIDVLQAKVIFDGKKTPIVSDHFGLHFKISEDSL
ncbi:MAG: endonuclease/exonuclease/phosphatase family protein [Streptococcaceae bacterium]|jgi:maltose 6'-phosphate phosphatase|nr:endonuclease/exonuclease/phosphatase family protein [Streptococcaceae bacterium]